MDNNMKDALGHIYAEGPNGTGYVKYGPTQPWIPVQKTPSPTPAQYHVLPPKATPGVFYLIWTPDSHLPPTVRFDTEDQAHKVADRMARRERATFYVLKAVEEIRVTETVTTRLG